MLKAMVMAAVLMAAAAAQGQQAQWAGVQGADQRAAFQIVPLVAGVHFTTNVVMDLPASDVVGPPQSVMTNIEGDCSNGTFVIKVLNDYSGKMGAGVVTGTAIGGSDFEMVARRVQPGSAMDAVLGTLCKGAK